MTFSHRCRSNGRCSRTVYPYTLFDDEVDTTYPEALPEASRARRAALRAAPAVRGAESIGMTRDRRDAPTRVIVWAPPRSRSTAFERSLSRHSRATVAHETLTEPFLKERNAENFARFIEAKRDADVARDGATVSYAEALRALANAKVGDGTLANANANASEATTTDEAAFFASKELSCYYDEARIIDAWMMRFKHVVLVRDPCATLKSFYRVGVEENNGAYFDVSEAGFYEAFIITDRLNRLGAEYMVLDADMDLLNDPESTFRSVCDFVGTPFEHSMLEWEAKERRCWQSFRGWHDDVASSTGFEEIKKPAIQYPPEVFAGAARCMPYYEAVLWSRRRAFDAAPVARTLSLKEHRFSIIITADENDSAGDMYVKLLAASIPGASVYILPPDVARYSEQALLIEDGGFAVCGTKSSVLQLTRALENCGNHSCKRIVHGLIVCAPQNEQTANDDDGDVLPFPCTSIHRSVDCIERSADELARTIESDLRKFVSVQ